jgi:hypothetical protein
MRPFLFIFILALTLSGCGTRELIEVAEQMTTTEVEPEIPQSWTKYVNTAYGYALLYPNAGVLYVGVTEEHEIDVPSSDARLIRLTDASIEEVLSSQVNTLTIEVIEGERSAHEWVSEHLEEYIVGGVAGQTVGEFAGQDVITIRGAGTPNSVEKLMVFERGGVVYVVSYQKRSSTFEQILETFEWI